MPTNETNISTYCQEDINRLKNLLPKDLKIVSKGIGIRSVHEIKYTPEDNNEILWKIVSVDKNFTSAQFKMAKLIRNIKPDIGKEVRVLRTRKKM